MKRPSPQVSKEDEEFPNLASRRLYNYLLADSSYGPFLKKPDPEEYQDYYKTIAKPIALEDMWEAMAGAGHGRYTLSDMQRDFRRMISNAKKYNRTDSLIYQLAITLERVCRKGVKEIEQDGMDDGDEDCLYMKINLRDRKYYEAQQRDNAILFEQKLLAQRRNSIAVINMLHADPKEEEVKRDADIEVDYFVNDSLVFLRGCESWTSFASRVNTARALLSEKSNANNGEASLIHDSPWFSHFDPAPGTILNPIKTRTRTAKELDAAAALAASPPVEVFSQAQSPTSSKGSGAGARPVQHSSSISSNLIKAGVKLEPADGSVVFVSFRLKGEPERHPLIAKLPASYVPPPARPLFNIQEQRHYKICKLCGPFATAEAYAHERKLRLQRTMAVDDNVLVPNFRQLSTDFLRCRASAPSSSSYLSTTSTGSAQKRPRPDIEVMSPVVVFGIDDEVDPHKRADAEERGVQLYGPAFKRLAKLSRELGSALAVDPSSFIRDGDVPLPQSSSLSQSKPISKATGQNLNHSGAASVTQAPPTLLLSSLPTFPPGDKNLLDPFGYDASISNKFWMDYKSKKASINDHADSLPRLASTVSAIYSARGTTNGLAAFKVPGILDTKLAINYYALEDTPFEPWLIRKRLHYCETHCADSHEESPIFSDWSSSHPTAQILVPIAEQEHHRLVSRAAFVHEGKVLPAPATTSAFPPLSSFAPLFATSSIDNISKSNTSAFPTATSKLTSTQKPVKATPSKSNATVEVATSSKAAAAAGSGTGASSGSGTVKVVGQSPSSHSLAVGMIIDVEDDNGQWWPAVILSLRVNHYKSSSGSSNAQPPQVPLGNSGIVPSTPGSPLPTSTQPRPVVVQAPFLPQSSTMTATFSHVRVHYSGWPDELDEWVSVTRTAQAFSRSNPPGAHYCPTCGEVVATSNSSVAVAACDGPGCCRVYHMACIKRSGITALSQVSSAWICPDCKKTKELKK